MTDYDDLCKRLRGSANFLDKAGFTGFPLIAKDCRESADAIAALREQVAELEKYAPPKSDRGGPRDPTAIWFDKAKALEAENAAIRELMNVYNLGGWTDAIAPMKRALAAEADNAALREQVEAFRREQIARSKIDPVTRLHNLCDHLAEQRRESPFTAESLELADASYKELCVYNAALRKDEKRLDWLDIQADDWTYKGSKVWKLIGPRLSIREVIDDAMPTTEDAALLAGKKP